MCHTGGTCLDFYRAECIRQTFHKRLTMRETAGTGCLLVHLFSSLLDFFTITFTLSSNFSPEFFLTVDRQPEPEPAGVVSDVYIDRL